MFCFRFTQMCKEVILKHNNEKEFEKFFSNLILNEYFFIIMLI